VSINQVETKIAACRLWIDENITPDCSPDDYAPGFERCGIFATAKDALVKYVEYLRKEFPDDAKRNCCSPSTWAVTLKRHFPKLLFGEAGFCGECFRFDEAISVLEAELKELKKNGMTVNKQAIREKEQALKERQKEKQEHQHRASELRALSNRWKYVFCVPYCGFCC
jgi:hypothetical protein